VAGIERDEGRVTGVTLADGQHFVAPVVVNVAGPHSAVINKMAGVYDAMNIKTAALRHEVHHVPAPPGIDFMTGGVVGADDDVGFYFRPEVGNNVLIGSVDPDCDDREFVDPDDYDTSLTEEQWNAQVLRANRRIPSLGVPHDRKGIVDLYDVSDDWLPIYDRTDLDGFYVAIGTSGNQYKNAGVAGQVMADLIEAVEDGHDHDADPLQTTGHYTGRPIDMSAYSRNREINPDSSMSVHG
jgi:sarcosine oxidase subunit beta